MNANRKQAVRMIDQSLRMLSMGAFTLDDLPDTFNLCAGIDELEEMIELAHERTSAQDLRNVAQDVASQLLDEVMLSE